MGSATGQKGVPRPVLMQVLPPRWASPPAQLCREPLPWALRLPWKGRGKAGRSLQQATPLRAQPSLSGSLCVRPGALPLLRGEPDGVPDPQCGQPPCLDHRGEVVHGAAAGCSPGRVWPAGWSDDGTVAEIQGIYSALILGPLSFCPP